MVALTPLALSPPSSLCQLCSPPLFSTDSFSVSRHGFSRSSSAGVVMGITVGSWLAHTPLAVGSALPALVFVVIGHVCRCFSPHRWAKAPLGVLLLVSSAGLVASGISRPLNLKIGDWGTPIISAAVAIAISWGMLLLARAFINWLPNQVGSIATWFAVAGFTIILMHPAVLWGVRADTADGNVVVFTAALLVPLAVGRVALHTPLSPWMTGIPKINQTKLTRAIEV